MVRTSSHVLIFFSLRVGGSTQGRGIWLQSYLLFLQEQIKDIIINAMARVQESGLGLMKSVRAETLKTLRDSASEL